MPVVWTFLSSWPHLVSVVASAACYDTLSRMAIVRSHFWFGHCFSLGWSVFMAVAGYHFWFGRCFVLLLWCLLFGRFVPAPSFGASAPPSMLEVDCMVLSVVVLLVFLPWWERHDFRSASTWVFPPCSSIGILTLMPPVNLRDTYQCILGGWSAV